MSICICKRIFLAANSYYKFQLQNALSPPTITRKFCMLKQENSEAVRTLLRNHGFTNTQIAKVVQTRPQVLSADPDNTLLPKLEFLSSLCISRNDLSAIISKNPSLLSASVEKTLVPAYYFLKSRLLSDEIVAKSIKRDSRILFCIVGGHVRLNLDFLNGIGVPQLGTSFILLRCPSMAYQNHDKLKRFVEDVIEMGFNPLKRMFIKALQVKCGLSKSTWDRKLEVYRWCGMSDEDILLAFKKHPLFMILSEEKITRKMDFFVNEMSLKPEIIARNSEVLLFDLEKRIIPRCRVLKILMSKGLVKKTMGLTYFLKLSEKKFLDRFVRNYCHNLPELIKIYLGEIVLLEP